MTTAGWIFMFGSVTAVLSLATWCYAKILTAPRPDSDQSDQSNQAGTEGAQRPGPPSPPAR